MRRIVLSVSLFASYPIAARAEGDSARPPASDHQGESVRRAYRRILPGNEVDRTGTKDPTAGAGTTQGQTRDEKRARALFNAAVSLLATRIAETDFGDIEGYQEISRLEQSRSCNR